ncbi:MAG: hypothetical protein ACRCUY_02220 [Thermoguttaceae bacterium]
MNTAGVREHGTPQLTKPRQLTLAEFYLFRCSRTGSINMDANCFICSGVLTSKSFIYSIILLYLFSPIIKGSLVS